LGKYGAKLSIHNIFRRKFAAVCRKIATSCPAYFLTYDPTASAPYILDRDEPKRNASSVAFRKANEPTVQFSLILFCSFLSFLADHT